jgi:5-(carboxyamino)imidazole ribonucleotide synthase
MGLQLHDPEPSGAAGMCNILGDMMPARLPPEPVRMYLHGYGKSFRPGRKMGHLTLIGPDLALIRRAARDIGLG